LGVGGSAASWQGMEPELRREVWKYLLGHVPYPATHAERDRHLAIQRCVAQDAAPAPFPA
jgi:hypothetical protein